MKLLHILGSINYSGAEIMLKTAAPYFIEQGIELHALAIESEKGEFAEQLAEVGYTIHHKPLSKSISYLLQQKRWFEKMNFDIVHIHPEKTFIIQAIACRLANVNSIRTIHTIFGFTGFLKFRKGIERFIARSCGTKMVAISDSVCLNESRKFWNKSTTIYNWTDENRFYYSRENREELRKEFGYSPDDRVVLTVGSCQEVKRHEHIIKAFKEIDNKRIKYLQVGSGPTYEEEKDLVKQFDLSNQINFVPVLDNPEIAYKLADIFVMTSKYEGISVATIEAMHCGLMSILYNVDGLSELLLNEHGKPEDKAGLLIEENPSKLAQEIFYWSENDKAREQKGVYASKWIKTKYSRVNSLDQYIQLYKN